jgi:hypothetical protein
MLPTSFAPRSFGKEYHKLKGDKQWPMFAAVALGVKPSFDEWVDVSKYNEFVEACAGYGLVVEPDVIFVSSSQPKSQVIGGNNITTTFQIGRRFDLRHEEGQVHVYVAKTKELAFDAKRFGWYSVVINNRSTNKPFVDHLRFGKCLGYPACCVDFFRKYNNWHLYNHPYETLKNTEQLPGRAIGSYHCNNFLMDNTFFFIHNLPCSYRCKSTIELAKNVEAALKQVEPEYVEKTMELLKKPLLVFGEKNFILFDGLATHDNSSVNIKYQDCVYFQNPARPEDSVNFFDSIKAADTVNIGRDVISIRDRGQADIKKKQEWFAIDFD